MSTIDWSTTELDEYEASALFGEPESQAYCDVAPIPRSSVARVVHLLVERGDFAETTVWAVFELVDGTYAYVEGGCDATGWDCRSSTAWELAPTLDDLWPLIGDEARSRLGAPSALQVPR